MHIGSLCRSHELATTEIYNDFLLRFGIVHGMFGLVENKASRWASLSLYRDASSSEFQVTDLETINLLISHIQRAFRLHFQFSDLKARSDEVETTLNMLTIGVVFLGSDGDIVLMNRRAEELVNDKDGLVVAHGKLCASADAESTRLRGIIVAATQTSIGKGLSAGGVVLISRRKGQPLSVTVAPLRNVSVELGGRPCVVLFIADPDQEVQLPADLLRSCYGLTIAEARLTMLLLEGHSLKEAAELCRVTQNTAKSQLKSIFAKTQVRRQSELVKLLLINSGHTMTSRI